MEKRDRRKPKHIDATKAAYTLFGRGIKRGNPRKCITCDKTIKRADTWELNVSAEDPKYGRYSVIRHSECVKWNPNENKRGTRGRK